MSKPWRISPPPDDKLADHSSLIYLKYINHISHRRISYSSSHIHLWSPVIFYFFFFQKEKVQSTVLLLPTAVSYAPALFNYGFEILSAAFEQHFPDGPRKLCQKCVLSTALNYEIIWRQAIGLYISSASEFHCRLTVQFIMSEYCCQGDSERKYLVRL